MGGIRRRRSPRILTFTLGRKAPGETPGEYKRKMAEAAELMRDHLAGHPKYPHRWCALCEYAGPNPNSPFQALMRALGELGKK